MWDPRAFQRRWRAEFPGAEAPVPRLESVRDAERELERCRLNLERLQQVLAEEQLKASLLQAALAGGGGGDSGDPGRPDPEAESPRGDPGRPDPEAESPRGDPGRPDPEAESPRGDPGRPDPEAESPRGDPGRRDPEAESPRGDPGRPDPEAESPRGDPGRPDPEAESPRGDPGRPDPEAESPRGDLPAGPGAAGEAGGGRSWADAVHQQLLQPQLRFRAREDDAPLGDPQAAPGTDEGGDGSDHDFEMVDFNEKFILSHWLVAPCRFGTREQAQRPGRACSPHRWMHLIPGGRRPQRGTRDLEQREAEAKDRPGSPLAAAETPRREHLPPWRRHRFLRVPERDSPGHSSPERDSDGSRHSSDREEDFSAGCSVCWGHVQTSGKGHGPHQPPLRTRFLPRRRRPASWLSRSLGARGEGEA
ncbi:breakpoint cluster region protein-like [Pan paniscus]|uniref:breakpoint cluster region protein-like n=1 Tax=Pan paniscus TaxID=9597 RepID=UPI0030048B40